MNNNTTKATVATVNLGELEIEGLLLPDGNYAIGKKKPCCTYPEHCYRDGLQSLLGGKCESRIDSTCLRVDLEFESCVIEVKKANYFTEAIGQVLHYAYLLNKTPVIAFFGEAKESEIKAANSLGITCINVDCCYKKINNINKKADNTCKTDKDVACYYDYSNHEVLVSRVGTRDLLAFDYIYKNPESVLFNCLTNQDHYSLWFFFSIITRLSYLKTVKSKYFCEDSFHSYPFLMVEKHVEDKIKQSNTSLVNVIHDVYIWLIHHHTQQC